MTVSDYLIWAAVLASAALFYFWERRVRHRAQANFEALAGKYRLKISSGGPQRKLCAEGTLDDRIFRFSKFREQADGQGRDLLWFELEVSPAALGFTFHIQEKTVGRTLAGELGEAGVAVGDPEFDRRWYADTNQPKNFLRVFSPDLCGLLDAATAASQWGEIRLQDGWLSYREQYDLDGPDIQARFDGLQKMLVGLARAAEEPGGNVPENCPSLEKGFPARRDLIEVSFLPCLPPLHHRPPRPACACALKARRSALSSPVSA